jgi:hypothetical protein
MPGQDKQRNRQTAQQKAALSQGEAASSVTGERAVSVGAAQVSVYAYSGPLPPADELARMAAVYPKAPEIIFGQFEKQGDHRRWMEKATFWGDQLRSWSGMLIGGAICLAFGYWGYLLIKSGHRADGLAAIISPLVGLVGCFLYAQHQQRKERLSRLDKLAPPTSAASGDKRLGR